MTPQNIADLHRVRTVDNLIVIELLIKQLSSRRNSLRCKLGMKQCQYLQFDINHLETQLLTSSLDNWINKRSLNFSNKPVTITSSKSK